MSGKKYYRLTPADLNEHPIWVLAMDLATFSEAKDEGWDDDTGLVVPLPSDRSLVERLFENCICYARVRFVAANERQFTGMLKCWAGEGIESSHPTILTDDGQVDFYFGIVKPTAEQVAFGHARLGISSAELFPLTYHPDVSLPDGPPGGELEGFYYMELRGNDQEVMCVR
jgi:hypothetical protein